MHGRCIDSQLSLLKFQRLDISWLLQIPSEVYNQQFKQLLITIYDNRNTRNVEDENDIFQFL